VTSIYPLECLRFEPEGFRDDTESDRRKLRDMLNADIVDDLNASGAAFVSHTVLDDGFVIRVSIGNIHTTRADVERLWRRLTEIAKRRYAQCADAAMTSSARPRHDSAI